MNGGKVWALLVFIVLLVAFNTVAVMIVTGRNPVLGGGFNFFTGKWGIGRHKDNLGSKLFGYLWAGGVFCFDAVIVFNLIKAVMT